MKHYHIRPYSIIWWVKLVFEFVVGPVLFMFLLLGLCWLVSF